MFIPRSCIYLYNIKEQEEFYSNRNPKYNISIRREVLIRAKPGQFKERHLCCVASNAKRIKKIQDKIPDAVQNDLEAQGKAAPAEKKEKPPVGETVGFRMARQFAETEPGFKDFIVALANKLQNG